MKMKSYSKKKSRSMHLLIVALIALTAVTAGCSSGSNNNPSSEEGGVTSDGGGNGGQPSGNSGITEPGTAKPEPAQPGNNGSENEPPKETAISKAEGTYVGQADTHSAEIKTAEGTSVFQFDDSLAEKVGKIKDNSPVAIEYYSKDYNIEGKNVKQLWLTKIEALGS